jgi:hypothetical protein
MNMRSTFKLSATLTCGVVIIFFAVFVWPTRYRYENIINQNLVRIDRFSSEVFYLDTTDGEWKSFRPLPVAADRKTEADADRLRIEPYRPSPTPNVEKGRYPPYQPTPNR